MTGTAWRAVDRWLAIRTGRASSDARRAPRTSTRAEEAIDGGTAVQTLEYRSADRLIVLPSQDGDQAGAGGATDIRLLLYVAVVTTLSAALHILLRPDLVYGEQFLAFDQGNHLFLGHALRDGLTLYRDVAYPYGAASAYVLAGVDLVFRLSATTYIWTLTALNTAFVVLAAHVIRLHSTRAITAAVVLGGLVPMALTPGSIVGSYTTNSYIPLERLILIALTLTWSDPAARSRRRSMLAGAIVGAWQFVKFGGGVFGLAAWLAVDALALARVRARPVKWRIVLAGWGTLAGTAALVEALRWAVLFRWLPSNVAFDVAWPHYTAQLYTSVPYDVRWPTPDAMVLLTRYSLPTLALVLSCRALWAAPERRTHTAALALFLPGIFFVAGTLGYFGHIHTMRQYMWCVVPAAALSLPYTGHITRAGAFIVASAVLALMLKITLVNTPAAGLAPAGLPNGDRLWLTASQRDALPQVLDLVSRTQQDSAKSATIALPAAAGFFFYAGARPPTRHLWLIPHYVRPFEAEHVTEALESVQTVIVASDDRGDAQSFLDRAFGPALGRTLRRRSIRVEPLAPGWWSMHLAQIHAGGASLRSTAAGTWP